MVISWAAIHIRYSLKLLRFSEFHDPDFPSAILKPSCLRGSSLVTSHLGSRMCVRVCADAVKPRKYLASFIALDKGPRVGFVEFLSCHCFWKSGRGWGIRNEALPLTAAWARGNYTKIKNSAKFMIDNEIMGLDRIFHHLPVAENTVVCLQPAIPYSIPLSPQDPYTPAQTYSPQALFLLLALGFWSQWIPPLL